MNELIKGLIQRNESKIIMVVLDGLGGLPINGKTELETANTPNLDSLARESACGLHIPVSYGITPGSGPGHLGIFGYDPLKYEIGRGILEAIGLGLEVKRTDIAVRCNYATIKDGVIVERRAGRIPTGESRRLTERLQQEIKRIDEAEIIFAPGMEHRFALLIRFPDPISPEAAMISDTDPQKEGRKPLFPEPATLKAQRASTITKKLIDMAGEILKDQERANFILTRGFSVLPQLPSFEEAFGLRALAIATYPMYRGLARLVGMVTPNIEGTVEDEVNFLRQRYKEYDFFFLHVKKTDSYGEDGDFAGKIKVIEDFDRILPQIIELKPDVLIITGDHSTPSVLKSHGWHPVPVLIRSPYVLGRLSCRFTERECVKGELGILSAYNLIPLALANSLRLKKFGA